MRFTVLSVPALIIAATGFIFLSPNKAMSGHFTNISVTTYVIDADGSGTAYDVQSDGQGAYKDGVSGVSSSLLQNGYNQMKWGDWAFDTYSASGRTVGVSVDQDDAVQPGDPHYTAPANPPFWGERFNKAYLIAKCTKISHNMLQMTAGQSFTCPLLIKFPGTKTVHGQLQDLWLLPAYSWDTGLTEVSDVQVTCNAAAADGCTDWNVTPISGTLAVGRMTDAGTWPPSPDYGDWYLNFNFHVTRP